MNKEAPRTWHYSGGNGVVTIFEMGNSSPITYVREMVNAKAVTEAHNKALGAARREVWDAAITIASGKSKSGALMPSEIVEALEAAKADEQNQEGEIR